MIEQTNETALLYRFLKSMQACEKRERNYMYGADVPVNGEEHQDSGVSELLP